MSSLLLKYQPDHFLRSSNRFLYQVPSVNTVTYGYRSFSYYAPKIWNSLPNYIEYSVSVSTFMQHLKTFLISFFPDFQKRLKFPWFEVKLPDLKEIIFPNLWQPCNCTYYYYYYYYYYYLEVRWFFQTKWIVKSILLLDSLSKTKFSSK